MGITRREMLQSGMILGGALMTSRVWSFPPFNQELRIRKSALELPTDDPIFTKYARAVKMMHDLPDTDARSWKKQAQIHATFCKHGNGGIFLPWHRHYINQFERICGKLINDDSFALPYWDWSFGNGKIPDAFFDLNELNVEFWDDPGQFSSPDWPNIDTRGIRAIGKGVGVQDDPTRGGAFTSRSINSILSENQLERFAGRLEGSPHNSGHVVIGFPASGKPGHIGSGLSPLDPLFWLHHANVDRLWAQWQLAGNTNTVFDEDFNGQFVDEDGAQIDLSADGASDFSSLGYSYSQFQRPRNFLDVAGVVESTADSVPLLAAFLPENRITDVEPTVIGNKEPTKPVEVGIPTKISVSVDNLQSQISETRVFLDAHLPRFSVANNQEFSAEMLTQFGRPKTTTRRIFARLIDVKGDFKSPPIVNVFLNCPYLSPETPYTDVHYADTFAFFGVNPPNESGHGHGAAHAHQSEFVVELTNALASVDLPKAADIELQLMALGPDVDNPTGKFTVGRIEIFTA